MFVYAEPLDGTDNQKLSQKTQTTEDSKVQGEIIINYIISADGNVKDISVQKSSADKLLDNQAKRFVQKLKYPVSEKGDDKIVHKKYLFNYYGHEILDFPSIELRKMYAWRSYNNNKLVSYGYYVFTKLENGEYSGIQINSYWDTNWNVKATFSRDKVFIKTPQPWNESWVGASFDGETVRGTFYSNGVNNFELDIVETNKNDLMIQNHIKP